MQQKPGAVDEGVEADTIPEAEALPGHSGGDNHKENVPAYAWFIVALLLALNIHNQWTRALLYYLVSFKVEITPENARQYMNIDLGFGQEQYGLLASFGFTALYTLFTLVAGRVADGNNRAVVATMAAAGWSLTTLAQGLATSFDSVLATRAVTGVSQAFLTPPAYGLIASYVPESRLATANSIYASGIYVGGALASLSILLDNQLGWRGTSMVAGGVGLGIAGISALALRDKTAKEEDHTADEQSALLKKEATEEDMAVLGSIVTSAGDPNSKPLEEVVGKVGVGSVLQQGRDAMTAIRTVVKSPFVQILFAASALRFCAGYGIGVWKAPFYRQAFPGFTNQFSVANAFVISAGGVMSAILGGYIADKYAPSNPKVRLWVPAIGSLLAVPFWIGTVQADTFEMSIGMLFCEYIVAECWFGPALASLYKGVPKEFQGTAQGLFTVLTAFGNFMPVLIGSLQSSDGSSLPTVLAWTVSGAYVLSGLGFFAASMYMPETEKSAASGSEP